MTKPETDVLSCAKDDPAHDDSGRSDRHVSINVVDTTETTIESENKSRTKRPHRGAWVATPAELQEEEVDTLPRIRKTDVENIFRGSGTIGRVTKEEIDRVKQMHDHIAEGVDFNFNYYSLLIVASIIAALGLASDSTTTVISSMLLSPIMGPVIGMSYGTVICDWKLVRRSVRNEIASLLICILIGLVVGLACSWTELAQEWATDEMYSRGQMQSFLVALPVAWFSGLGVALSVLDDQTSSLVGVAISASLLPPAVNAGLLWIFAAMKNVDALGQKASGDNFVRMGGMSIALTGANILLVWISGASMFRVKEKLPIKKKVFWDDLTIARRIYQHRALLDEEEEVDDIDNVEQGMSVSPTRTMSEE